MTQEVGKAKREQIVQSVANHLVREGFTNSGIRALAVSAGLSDRMLMYYFETKEELIAEALALLTQNMAAALDQLLPERQTPAAEIVSTALASTQNPQLQASLRLWFEIVGLAVRGTEPYGQTAKQILQDWEDWIKRRLRSDQRHRAPEILAQVEGQLLLQLLRA